MYLERFRVPKAMSVPNSKLAIVIPFLTASLPVTVNGKGSFRYHKPKIGNYKELKVILTKLPMMPLASPDSVSRIASSVGQTTNPSPENYLEANGSHFQSFGSAPWLDD